MRKRASKYLALVAIAGRAVGEDVPDSAQHVFSHGIIPVSVPAERPVPAIPASQPSESAPPVPPAPPPVAALARLPDALPRPIEPPAGGAQRNREIAQGAWRYFESNLQASTGWFDSVKGYPFTTMWDLASGIAAVASAEKLDLITPARSSELLGRALETLSRAKVYGGELPNREYNTVRATISGGKPAGSGTGWSALDLGRLLIWLKIVEQWHPEHAVLIRKTVAAWNFGRLAHQEEMFGTFRNGAREQYRQEGRLGYEQYSASGFELWGMPMKRAKDYAETQPLELSGVSLRDDQRNLPHLTSEPFLLAAFELGAIDPIYSALTESLYRLQQQRWKTSGQVTAVSEDALSRAPWFTYFDVYYQGQAWQCRDHSGEPASACGFSSKAASGWASLYADDYAPVLDDAARRLASSGGYFAGRYADGKENTSLNINTNAVILEAMLFRQRGKRAFLETTP